MEFRVVFLIGLDLLPRAERKESNERSLVYVGLTRAQDALYILGAANAGFLKEIVSISEGSVCFRQECVTLRAGLARPGNPVSS